MNRTIIPALLVLTACPPTGEDSDAAPSARITCEGTGDEVEMDAAKLYIEYNFTDGDIGVHGAFDDHGWSELCVSDPNGTQILGVKPEGPLGDLTMAGIFFESREPPEDEWTFDDLKAVFPEGEYAARALSFDGTVAIGAATFTWLVPAPPTITNPPMVDDFEEETPPTVPATGLTVTWDAVSTTIDGTPLTVTGYEVIVTDEEAEDPNGFARPVYDVHVAADVFSLPVPDAFLRPETLYELEVLAIEASGNQTISVGFFETE